MPLLKTLHFPSPSGPSLNRYPETSLLIPVSSHLVFSLLRVGGGRPLSLWPSGFPLSFRTQQKHQETFPDPHPLAQVRAGSSSWALQWPCRLPSNSPCHIQSQVPTLHPSSPSWSQSHLWGWGCIVLIQGCFRLQDPAQGLPLSRLSGNAVTGIFLGADPSGSGTAEPSFQSQSQCWSSMTCSQHLRSPH